VTALATNGNVVFAGGTFSSIGGQANNRLAALDPVTGNAIPGWRASANAKVYSLAVSGGRVFAGGSFTTVNGQAAAQLAAVEAATGGFVGGWRPSTNGYVRALEMSADGTRVFVGGNFTAVSGSSHHFIAAVYADSGNVDNGFNGDAEYIVFDLAATPTAVFAAIGGPGGRVTSFNSGTGARNWRVFARGDVQAIAVDGPDVYAGGHFTGAGEFANVTRFKLAAVGSQVGAVENFAPNLSGQVWALTTAPGRLYAGGDFVRINGRMQQGFGQFSQ
jgi:hypothetical protein